MQYVVVYEQTPRNWSAYVPDLPVCIGATKTRREMERMMRKAVRMYVESCVEFDEPIPRPGTWTGSVEVKLPGTGGEERPTQYIVVYEQGPNNWSAFAPDVPGCIATGKTRQATVKRIKEAIEFHLEGLAEDGDPIPQPGTWTSVVEVTVPGVEAAEAAQ